MKLKGRKKLERGQPGAAGVGDTRGATDTDTAASLVSVHSWCGPAPQLAAITASVCACLLFVELLGAAFMGQ